MKLENLPSAGQVCNQIVHLTNFYLRIFNRLNNLNPKSNKLYPITLIK